MENLEKIINDAWENKEQINQNSDESILNSINKIIVNLDQGKLRVAEKIDGNWTTHQYIKKAIMLSFRIHGMEALSGPYSSWFDKSHLLKGKTAGWTKEEFEKAGFRMVPNTPVRKGSFIAKNVVLMPCFVNTETTIMFDDIAKNLVPASKIGFTTVWIDIGRENYSDDIESSKEYLDYQTTDLPLWLNSIIKEL